MVAVSIKIVEPTQMALDVDKIMIKIDEEKLWTNGRHFIGLGHEFILSRVLLKSLCLRQVIVRPFFL